MPTSASLFFRELAELHKANASRASEAEEAALSRDMQAKEQLTVALEKAQEEARIQQEVLADQVTHRWQKQRSSLFAVVCKVLDWRNPIHLGSYNVNAAFGFVADSIGVSIAFAFPYASV